MRTVMVEESMGSLRCHHKLSRVQIFSFFPRSQSLFLGIPLSACHTNIPHAVYVEIHKQPSTKCPLMVHVCAQTHTNTHRVASQACSMVLSADPASHGMVMCDSRR